MTSADITRPAATQPIADDTRDAPAVGRWYWVTIKDDRTLACVTRIGSNYVKLTYVNGSTSIRIHNDKFWDRCEFVEDANALLQSNAEAEDMSDGAYQAMCDAWQDMPRIPRSLEERVGYWRTRDGRVLEIAKMSRDHLANAISFFERSERGDHLKIRELRRELARRVP